MDELFRKNLRFLSKERGQVVAGEKAGVTQSAVSKIGTGATEKPSFQTIIGLAAHYMVSLDDLAYRDIEASGQSSQSQPVGFDDGTMAQAVELLFLMGDARPEDGRFRRPTWAMIQIAAKGIQLANGDARKAMSYILDELAKET